MCCWIIPHQVALQHTTSLVGCRSISSLTGSRNMLRLQVLLDGHAIHTKSVELFDLAREHNVVLLCFLPHCTHWMQPLDYSQEITKWQQHHPGRPVTIYQTAINGFRKTGIYPWNSNIFPIMHLNHLKLQKDFILSQSSSPPINEIGGSSPSPSLRDSQTASSSFSFSLSDVTKLPMLNERRKQKSQKRKRNSQLSPPPLQRLRQTKIPHRSQLLTKNKRTKICQVQKRMIQRLHVYFVLIYIPILHQMRPGLCVYLVKIGLTRSAVVKKIAYHLFMTYA
ncbi:hypothetical protein PR048_009141, partial [Dryococelus australis]